MSKIAEITAGFNTAYVDGNVVSDPAYRPQFVSNNYREGKKVITTIEEELSSCDRFDISVAFITLGGIAPLLQKLQELERKNIPGRILTTNYLNFSEPKALAKLNSLKNIEIRMFDAEGSREGFHTKGYIFKREEVYRIIIGSSNVTSMALTCNREWNTKIVSTEHGEIAHEIVDEFNELWNSQYALSFDTFYDLYAERYSIIRHQREMAEQESVTSLEKYRLEPNSMQVAFIKNLRNIISSGERRALLISATGTGKTYASAFAMRELGFCRVLFLVHRSQLAVQSRKSFERVFSNSRSMGIVGGGFHEYEADFVFATVQTLNKDEHLLKYNPDNFDCIVLDEAHHVSAGTYQKIFNHFTPKLWLGMTATPDKRDDNIEGHNIYELFNYKIAYEIRLQQAMEEDLLCPFHYFGISDISLGGVWTDKIDFNMLTSDERVRHVIKQANYFGYSGDRVKGLVFCSTLKESEELSRKFNSCINPATGRNYRTIALNGSASELEREQAFERLAMDEVEPSESNKSKTIQESTGENVVLSLEAYRGGNTFGGDSIPNTCNSRYSNPGSGKSADKGADKNTDSDTDNTPLDYIFSVEILNEGVDIVEVNQVIMLRPTQSPIVFIQQLGRGLRKARGKEFVVILDFIGNYTNNFMIPIALSGDRTYNPDNIRKYVISGNSVIPGTSTIHFDEVARSKIFASIDKIKGQRKIIHESFLNLENRLGRTPYLLDFYENNEVEPLRIIKEYRTLDALFVAEKKSAYTPGFTISEKNTLEYLSKLVLGGTRPHELVMLDFILRNESFTREKYAACMAGTYGYELSKDVIDRVISNLLGYFVTKRMDFEERYSDMALISEGGVLCATSVLKERLKNLEFKRQLEDILKVGLAHYHDLYALNRYNGTAFVLHEKYSRRDVALLMNSEQDLSSTMYGMWSCNQDEDVFLFVTYHKQGNSDESVFIQGKPDYADEFEDSVTFRWDSQLGKGVDSSYVSKVTNAVRKHLLVKKSDSETSFYYMGFFDITNIVPAKKLDKNGKEKDITKMTFKMRNPVREDLLNYLKSNIVVEEEEA